MGVPKNEQSILKSQQCTSWKYIIQIKKKKSQKAENSAYSQIVKNCEPINPTEIDGFSGSDLWSRENVN